jgi:Recombination endonuclease VII
MPEIITRDAAHAAGSKKLFTGKPCRRGHVAERYVNYGNACVECTMIANRDRRAGPSGAAYKALRNIEYQSPARRTARLDAARVQQANRLGHMPPPPESECPPRPADGCCQCCGKEVGASLLVLDHDHGFIGEFMGWCCQRCNTIGDDLASLQARVAYLIARGFT